MRPSTYISVAIALAACLAVYFLQRNRIAGLEEQIQSLQSGGIVVSVPGSLSALPDQNEPSAGSNGDPSSETEDIPTAEDLRALWPQALDMSDLTAAASAIPKLVEAVEHCSAAQLIEIADVLIGEKQHRSDRLIAKLLVILAAEEDPANALTFWDEHHQSIDQQEFVRSSILAQLAKHDMAMAREKIDRAAIDDNDLRRGRIAVAQELLKTDPDAGLAILAKGAHCDPCVILGGLAHGFFDSGVAVRVAARDPMVAEKLWEKVSRLDPGTERSILLHGLFETEALERGREGVSQAFDRLDNLEGEERDNLLSRICFDLSYSDTPGAIELCRDYSSSDVTRDKYVTRTFTRWIKREVDAASSWLRDQPSSNERDQLITHLVENIGSSDRGAALDWANEIGDEDLRASTIARLE